MYRTETGGPKWGMGAIEERDVLWVLFIIAVALILEARTQWMSRFSIYTALIAPLMIRYGPLVPLADDVNSRITGVDIDPRTMNEYYLALALAYIALTAGIFLASYPGRGPYRAPILPGRRLNRRLLYVAAAATIGILILVWVILPWQDFIDSFAAIFSADHTGELYRAHRVIYGTTTEYSSSALNYFGNFVRFSIAPAVLWILYADRTSPVSRYFAWVLFGILGIIGLLSGQKLPAVLLLLGLWMVWLVKVEGSKWITKRLILGSGGGVFVLLPTLYHLQYPTDSYSDLIGKTVFRLTAEYSRVAQLRFQFYPSIHPFLMGLNSFIVRGFVHLLGGNTVGVLPPELYLPSVTPGHVPDYGGTWNAGFFADAWADFGWFGVAIEAFAVGVWIALIYRWYSRSEKGAGEIGTYIALCFGAAYVSEVSLLTAGWMRGLVTSFLVLALLRLFPGRQHSVRSQTGRLQSPHAIQLQ